MNDLNNDELNEPKHDALVSVSIWRRTIQELYLLPQNWNESLVQRRAQRAIKRRVRERVDTNECSAGSLPVAAQLEFLLCVKTSSAGQKATCSWACWSEGAQTWSSAGCSTGRIDCLYKNYHDQWVRKRHARERFDMNECSADFYRFSFHLVTSNGY